MAVAYAIAGSVLEQRFYPLGALWLYDDNQPDDNPSINGLVTRAYAPITFQNIVPILLYIEFLRTIQAAFIHFDPEMYFEKTDQPALAKSWTLADDLGQIEYIFSDKTGHRLKTLWSSGNVPLVEKPIMANERSSSGASAESSNSTASPSDSPQSNDDSGVPPTLHPSTPKPSRDPTLFSGEVERYESMNILEFTSVGKRVSVVIRKKGGDDERMFLWMNGADNVVFERLRRQGGEVVKAQTERHLDEFAAGGLRTLTLAYKVIPAVSSEPEQDLRLLGATAIEDRLQDGVPETIEDLKRAGIKVWVATGDKLETAIVRTSSAETRISSLFEAGIIVVDGFTPSSAKVSSAPLEKALVVKLDKDGVGAMTSAIGDGANDVSTIQAAHVDVGIAGKEGLQAVNSSDYAIAQVSRSLGELKDRQFLLQEYPIGMGLFDRFVDARVLMEIPQLYRYGRQGSWSGLKLFGIYMFSVIQLSLYEFSAAPSNLFNGLNASAWTVWIFICMFLGIVMLWVYTAIYNIIRVDHHSGVWQQSLPLTVCMALAPRYLANAWKTGFAPDHMNTLRYITKTDPYREIRCLLYELIICSESEAASVCRTQNSLSNITRPPSSIRGKLKEKPGSAGSASNI
ncbi:hypothetical protein BDN72DRAFT_929654 [Pluteus cervinus]|uniref:Uncharacterized protein n=1 Tax=Pluteus cervinus TaxID=181527 RepID=A0ACD3AAI0_9AGAR|nr:hypothetical protein BDN72DRAFT_929654 [Pluteus cervinus]